MQASLQTLLKVLITGFIVVSVLFFVNQGTLSRYFFPIREVKLYGVDRLSHQELETILRPFLQEGFFAVNIDLIHDRLSLIPWVSNVMVRRRWPDQIQIVFHERKPIALWNENSLLSEDGELFIPKKETIPDDLPQFIGGMGQQMLMLTFFKRIDRLFSILHVKLKTFELTPYFTWKLTLDNGIIMQVGYKDMLSGLTHFVKVYPKIMSERKSNIEYIDLRYPNGMAIKWKS